MGLCHSQSQHSIHHCKLLSRSVLDDTSLIEIVFLCKQHVNPFYPEYDSSRSYPFYPEYDSGRSLHLARLPCTLAFWNPIGWLTLNDVSISGSLGNPYFLTNQCCSLGICCTKSAPQSQSEIKDGVESQRSLNVDVFRRITPLIYFILFMTRRQTSG